MNKTLGVLIWKVLLPAIVLIGGGAGIGGLPGLIIGAIIFCFFVMVANAVTDK